MKKNQMGVICNSNPIEKILRIMKLSVFLLFIGFVQVFANNSFAQKTKLSLDVKNASIESVLTDIENQSYYKFIYNKEKIDVDSRVSIQLQDKSIKELLDILFEGQNVNYSFFKNNIVLSNAEAANVQMQQSKPISGRVTDSSGATLPGVTIVLKGKTIGTITDIDGKFSLSNVSVDATLKFSFIGLEPQEISVAGKSVIDVTMQEETVSIGEVVAIGYGTQKKKDVTGAVSSVDIKGNGEASGDLSLMLQGQAAGVTVTANTGAPGGGISVNIRGLNSFSFSQPLYVVDGIPLNTIVPDGIKGADGGNNMNSSPLSSINPEDIASIDILKDASSCAIYGTRASNGVVLITTKHGKMGKSTTSFKAYYGVQSAGHKVDVLNSSQFSQYMTGLYGAAADTIQKLSKLYNTDWQKYIMNSAAPIQSYQFNHSGGDEKTQYSLNVGYFNQSGIVKTSGFDRYSLRANLDTKATKWLKLGTNINVNRSGTNVIVTDNIYYSPLMLALENQPTSLSGRTPAGYMEGSTHWDWYGARGDSPYPLGNSKQPLAQLEEERRYNLQNSILANVYAEITLMDGLFFKTSISEDYSYSSFTTWVPIYLASNTGSGGGTYNNSFTYNSNMVFDNTLTFSRKINDHSFTVLAGVSAEKGDGRYLTGGTDGFLYQNEPDMSIGQTTGDNRSVNGWTWRRRMASTFARLNYSFKGKYLITATDRRDGSDVFGNNNKFANLPSVSLGWIASDEAFMKGITAISNLKLRAGYGITGNQNIGNYLYYATIAPAVGAAGWYTFGLDKHTVSGTYLKNIANQDIQWERQKQLNIGADISLFNRVTLNLDYYSKLADKLLSNLPMPTSTGFGSMAGNIGSISNKGVEINLTSENLKGKLTWTTNFNISYNKNEVKSLAANLPITTDYTQSEVGQPIGQFYGLVDEGIFQTDAEAQVVNADGHRIYPNASAGDIKWKDVNGDGIIDSKDRTYIGDPHPKIVYGFNNSFSFKGLDLSIALQGVYGNKIYYGMGNIIERMTGSNNQSTRVLDSWTLTNYSTTMPRAVIGDPNGNSQDPTSGGLATSRWIEDGSYMKVKNITLGYKLPSKLADKAGLSMVRIYASLVNWFTFTKYPGYSPEIGAVGGDILSTGIDYGNYPIARSISFGINIDLK